ncbi:MAG: alpha-amylase, partial [Anaerolineales bacterium]
IIRFDAAMTLANEHIKRLWYPTHGVGGAIPSRYDHEMTIEEFNKLMPKEFWREVVDRVEKDVPGTLLLAEAFWLMEGYFVRTLGMHRVYNSAFMHMLRDEDNDKYRTLIKNVLEYDPQILQRFVNFMNNPDEKPAVEQFGKGDKYLGVCTLMVSMPGLPMFGHGQIEGYREKYGMEYKKADLDETPDEGLLKAHEWHIFPLLKQREIFASIKNFVLYDFMNKDGTVDENVIVYSNCLEAKNKEGENRYSLIVYHNKNTHSNGYIKDAAGIGSKGNISHVNLGKALNLNKSDRQFIIYRDLENNLEYIRSSKRIMDKGLFLRLKGYQHHAFLNFRTVEDSDGKWKKVNNDLKGKGYWSIKARYDEMFSSSKKHKRD